MASLPHLLRINAASCLGFGAVFLSAPGTVSALLGSVPQQVLVVIGAGLLINGLHLSMASMRAAPRPAEIIWFSLGDLLWWASSLAVVASARWITTSFGIVSVLLVALAVAALGLAQLAVLGMARSGLSGTDHWRRIGQSWLSLPGWVKVWLFVLNLAFLAAPVFLSWTDGHVVLLAYAATGPLLLGFALYEGGMSRIMGVGHLLPWVPLLGWLGFRWAEAGPGSIGMGYLAGLAALIVLCLAFDVYDIIRWIRGERGLLIAAGGDT